MLLLQGPYYQGSQFQPSGSQRSNLIPIVDPAASIFPPYWKEAKAPAPVNPLAELASNLSIHQQRQQCQIVQV